MEKSTYAQPPKWEKKETVHDNGLSAAPLGRLAVCCFGKLTMSIGGRYIIMKNKKARELISYLLCTKGKPVLKARLAEVLWPDTTPTTARSSLNKVCAYLREFSRSELPLPIVEKNGEIWFDLTDTQCDIIAFEALYSNRDDLESCAQAVNLYKAQLFLDECYEWVVPYEAYYDIRYVEMVGKLEAYYTDINNGAMAAYFRSMLT